MYRGGLDGRPDLWKRCARAGRQSGYYTSAGLHGEDACRGVKDGWITNGGTLSNQRYSPLDQINRDNVKGLKGVWHAHLDGSGNGQQYSGEAQPLVYDGVIYIGHRRG